MQQVKQQPPKKSVIRIVFKLIHDIVLYPIHAPVELIHNRVKLKPKQKKMAHITIGAAIAYVGVLISAIHLPETHLFHYTPEYLGFFLHAAGLTPAIKAVGQMVGIEL